LKKRWKVEKLLQRKPPEARMMDVTRRSCASTHPTTTSWKVKKVGAVKHPWKLKRIVATVEGRMQRIGSPPGFA
jgi:hypothetical protein